MGNKLTIDYKDQGDHVVVQMKGVIDEEAKFAPEQVAEGKDVVFDFDGLTGINSLGIRSWVKFVQSLGRPGEALSFTKCRSIIVDQINMVADFVPEEARILDFYVPYSCEECNTEVETLVTADSINDPDYEAPRCSKCKAPMEMDTLEDEYFQFLHESEQ